MQGTSIFQRKAPLRSKQRNIQQSYDKVSIKDFCRSSLNRDSTPRCTGLWDSSSVCSQRNSVGKSKIKNSASNFNTLKYQRKANSRGNSHRYNKSAENITSMNTPFATCQVTPNYSKISPRNGKESNQNTNPRAEYKFIYQIGFGGFGKVWKVQKKKQKCNREFAMKQIDKRKVIMKKSVDSVMNQLKILSILDHPFLINMNRAFQNSDNLYLVMDYLRGADLRYHICYKVKFSETEARFIIACVIISLQYVHSCNIIHRDLKPQNIVFQENGYARLTDFGIAKIKVQNKPFNLNQTSGTPGYMAPQILFKQDYSFVSDFFALGVIAYELMLNKRPYEGQNRKQIRQSISEYQAQVKRSQIPKGWSCEAADFINHLLQRNPKYRLGNTGIQDLKNHKWMSNIKWPKLQKKNVQPPFCPGVVCETREYLEQIMLYNELNEQVKSQKEDIPQEDELRFQKYNYQKATNKVKPKVNNFYQQNIDRPFLSIQGQKQNINCNSQYRHSGNKIEVGKTEKKTKKSIIFKKSRKCSQQKIFY